MLATEVPPRSISARLKNGLLFGSLLLFVSSTLVNAGNYLFNLILGRWLGPVAFADLSLIVTLMLVITCATTTLQLVAARFAAIYHAAGNLEQLAGLRHWLVRRAGIGGVILLLVLVLGAPLWQQFFHTESALPFVILGVGLPLYLMLGVERGVLQGQTRFGKLALSYQAEMWVRLGAAIGLVALGFTVNGAVVGLALSFGAAWLVARTIPKVLARLSPQERSRAASFAAPAAVALIGQVLITNTDVIIVKHFFDGVAAGQYAALSLVGRIVFFATWSVVTTLFPLVASKQERREPHRHLLWLGLGLVAVVAVPIVLATMFVPTLMIEILFGAAYLSVVPLLWLSALGITFYALANVVISYHLALGNPNMSYLAIAAGVGQIVGLIIFHESLLQVVQIQVSLTAALFITATGWDWWLHRQS